MRVFLFSFWYLPDNRTAVNRVKYFNKKFKQADIDVNLIYCDDNNKEDSLYKKSKYKIPHIHRFYKLSNYLLRKNWLFLYKIVHFFYLVTSKRDVYDFYRNYREIESAKAINLNKSDVVITTAPPYSTLNIGYYLKRKFGVKWIIDYRDPWTLGYPTLAFSVFADKIRKVIQRKEELKFLEEVDQIITVSESLKKTFPEKFQHKIKIIPNGANTDEMEFFKIQSRPNVFSIVYAGTIHSQQLENTYFFDVLKKFIVEQEILPKNFKLHFIGSADSPELKSLINNYNLNDYVNITERIELTALYEYMYEASMFLHLRYADRDKIITSKQYDYLALQKPILLPESDNGDLEESIKNNNSGYVCNSKEELYFILQKEYSKFINNEDVQIYRDEQFLKNISRNTAAEKLLDIIYTELNSNIDLNKDLDLIAL